MITYVDLPVHAASGDVKQAYRQFLGAVIQLVNGEIDAEELKEVTRGTYEIFSGPDTDYDSNNWISEKKY